MPVTPQSHRFQLADGAEICTYTDGPADPRVTAVLVHGLSVTADLWRLHTPLLTDQDVRVVRYDHRAHGQSSRGTAPITLETLADDLAHVIDRLAPHGELLLAGHSMGGMIVQTLTTRRPDLLPRVRGLLLLSTPDGPVVTRTQKGLRPRLTGWGRDLLAVACARAPRFIDTIRRHLPGTSPWALSATSHAGASGSVPACRRGLHRTATRDITSYWRTLATTGSRPVEGLRLLGSRVTLIAGTADSHVPAEHTQALSHRLPQARLVLADASHALPVRRPQLIVDALTHHLAPQGPHTPGAL